MLAATTIAVVSAVGASVMAMQPDPRDVSAKSNDVPRISDDVLSFLDGGSVSSHRQAVLPTPLAFEVAKHRAAPFAPQRPEPRRFPSAVQPDASNSTELPLVPLPPPLYTGAAGLIGLGMVRMWNRLRKTF